jgi:hypothetical protein
MGGDGGGDTGRPLEEQREAGHMVLAAVGASKRILGEKRQEAGGGEGNTWCCAASLLEQMDAELGVGWGQRAVGGVAKGGGARGGVGVGGGGAG